MWTQVGPSPIQISEVESTLRIFGVEDPSTKLKYVRLIQMMDGVELSYHASKTAQGTK